MSDKLVAALASIRAYFPTRSKTAQCAT